MPTPHKWEKDKKSAIDFFGNSVTDDPPVCILLINYYYLQNIRKYSKQFFMRAYKSRKSNLPPNPTKITQLIFYFGKP